MAEKDIIIAIKADTKPLKRGLSKSETELNSFSTRITSKFKKAGKSFAASMVGYFAIFQAGGALFRSVKSFATIQRETTLNVKKFNIAAGDVRVEADKTIKMLRTLSTEMGIPLEKLSEAYGQLATSGLSKELSDAIIAPLINFQEQTSATLSYVTDKVPDIFKIAGVAIEDYGKQLNFVAKSSFMAELSTDELLQQLSKASSTMQKIGLQETTALVLDLWSVFGEQTHVHIRQLVNGLEKAKVSLKNIGIDVYDNNGKMRSTVTIIGEMNAKMVGMSDEQKTNFINLHFANERAKEGFKIVHDSVGGISTTLKEIVEEDMVGLNDELKELNKMGAEFSDVWLSLAETILPAVLVIAKAITSALHTAIEIYYTVMEKASGFASKVSDWVTGAKGADVGTSGVGKAHKRYQKKLAVAADKSDKSYANLTGTKQVEKNVVSSVIEKPTPAPIAKDAPIDAPIEISYLTRIWRMMSGDFGEAIGDDLTTADDAQKAFVKNFKNTAKAVGDIGTAIMSTIGSIGSVLSATLEEGSDAMLAFNIAEIWMGAGLAMMLALVSAFTNTALIYPLNYIMGVATGVSILATAAAQTFMITQKHNEAKAKAHTGGMIGASGLMPLPDERDYRLQIGETVRTQAQEASLGNTQPITLITKLDGLVVARVVTKWQNKAGL